MTPEENTQDQEQPVSLRAIIRQKSADEDMPMPKNKTFKKIIGGDILTTEFLRKQIWLILLVVAFLFLYISNRYTCQKSLIKIDKLKKDLVNAKYRALSSGSELTQRTRESKVLDELRMCSDSTLHIASQPPYIVNVKDEEADN